MIVSVPDMIVIKEHIHSIIGEQFGFQQSIAVKMLNLANDKLISFFYTSFIYNLIL